jgi:hypothetical protein
MFKQIAILIVMIINMNALASYTPTSIKGQGDVSASNLVNLQVPNKQATKTGPNTYLNETSNKNILDNPSFEHQTYGTSWDFTSDTSTKTEELTLIIDGKKSAKFVATAQVISMVQSSTLYAGAFADGVQGLATCRIKSDVALKFCSRNAGVTSTSNCVDVNNGNTWGLYKLPTILGAVSNGVSIASTGAVTGTVYVDDCFLGAQSLTQNIDASKIAGESYFAGTTSCIWTRASATVGAFTAVAACPGPTITQSNLGEWQATDSNLPRQTINNLPAGNYKATFYPEVVTSAGGSAAITITDGTTTCEPQSVNGSNANTDGAIVSCVFSYTNSGNRSFEIFGGLPTGTLSVSNIRTAPRSSMKFQLEYFGSDSTYSSTNADTDWASCNFSTLAWQGLGTVTNTLECKRNGSDLLMRGVFSTGTTSANIAQVPLPLWNGVQLNNKTSLSSADYGKISRSVTGASTFKDMLALGSSTARAFFTIGVVEYASTAAALTAQNGNFLFAASESITLNLRIPIAGWENSNLIIGSFSGIEKCADSYECTDTFSAKASGTGVVSDENLDFINGSGVVSGTSVFTYTFTTGVFSASPNCGCVVNTNFSSGSDRVCQIVSTSNTTLVVLTNANGSLSPQPHNISCQKTGADYIGKTAKAVASDQNVRSIGAVGVDVQSVYFGGAAGCTTNCTTGDCFVCTRVGTKITTVSWGALGVYHLNGIDGTKYNCTGANYALSNGYGVLLHNRNLSTALLARLDSAAGATAARDSAYNAVTCTGIP